MWDSYMGYAWAIGGVLVIYVWAVTQIRVLLIVTIIGK
jgi:hypothetical protein